MRRKLLILAVLGFAAFTIPSVANAASVSREGVKASTSSDEVDSWNYVTVCDTKADGNSVYSIYYRDSGSKNTIAASGNGHCQTSGSDSRNLVSRFNACNDLSLRPDPCTSYVYR